MTTTMTTTMNKLFVKTWVAEAMMFVIAFFAILPTATAAELDLPTAPLVTTKSVKPNMMLLLDSSGSMEYIVEDSTEYDASTYNYSCSTSTELNNSYSIRIRIENDGDAYFNQNGNDYDFGNSIGNGITGRTQKCFKDGREYYAELYAAEGTSNGLKSTTNYPGALYDGNFLNWYFYDSNFSLGARKRDDTQTRIEVARSATISLLDSLSDIKVGLSQFDSGNGVKILANIIDIETAKVNLKAKVGSIDAGAGGTPLAEALQELGRYFTIGYSSSSNLTIHPTEINEADVKVSDFFTQSPTYLGVSAPSSVTQNWCEQNYIVAMTDGQSTNDQSNFSSYLQDYDGDCVGASCGSHDKKISGGYNYENSGSDYADDVILAMYDIDLRPDLKESETKDTKNNVSTYMVGFAEQALINDPLMADMAAAGGGGELLTAANSNELLIAFKTATDSLFARVAAGSGAAFNTTQLTAGSAIYAGSFNTEKWSGNLKSYNLLTSGAIDPNANWDVAEELLNVDYATRNVFSYNETTKKGIVFNETSLSTAQINDLKAGPKGTTGVASLVNYLKGDVSNEGSGATDYRERAKVDVGVNTYSNVLGDIVNSTVVHVGAPELNWPGHDADASVKFGSAAIGDNYSDFKAISRTPMLYVGANDGMLHGFSAIDGEEKMAYIPGLVASNATKQGLHYLAETDYEHHFYVDLSPTVSDVYFDSEWRSVLIGGLRSGGKGLFALDITDPTKFDDGVAGNAVDLVLWEFSTSNDVDFGYSYSEPTVAMMKNGRWAVIVGNGYNNSGDGNAKLFIIYLDKNTITGAVEYVEVDTGVGADSSEIANGLSTPRVIDLDGDSVVDRIYAGDLQGNMWAFNVDNSNTSKWEVAHEVSNSPVPLFTAKDSADKAQPITTAPIVAKNKNSSANDPDLIVFFGTGKYIEETDKISTDIMSYYGVLDDGDGELDRTYLTPRALYSTTTTRVISGVPMSWASKHGWYLDFVDQANSSAPASLLGERVISNSLIVNDVLLFNTVIPTTANSDPCAPNSESWIMAVDLNTGKAPLYTVFDINNDGTMDDTTDSYDVDGDGDVDADDKKISFGGTKIDSAMIAGDIAILGTTVYSNDVDGNLNELEVNIEQTEKEGRLSWEELILQ